MTENNYMMDYEEFCGICYTLLDAVLENGKKYDGILCPLRGGFYLSNFMSRHLDLPIEYIIISSYNGKEQSRFSVPYMAKLEKGTYLLCDDIYDSGRTIDKIYELYPGVKFDIVCVASKDENAEVIYGCHVERKIWIDFFWEIM